MNNWIFIAIGAGLTAAALQATIAFSLAPLPLFLVGLGWSPIAAAVGGLVGSVALATTIGLSPGIFFIISTATAPVVLSYLALINRPAQATAPVEGEATDDAVEWYPEGRLILWCALIGCGLMTATVLATGSGAEGFQAAIDKGFDEFLAQVANFVSAAQLAQFRVTVAIYSKFAAPIGASVWLLVTLFNLWVASTVLTASARSPRPWAPFRSYALPQSSLAALVIACLAAFLPGTLGLIGWVGLALMTTTFTIIGLAALHGLTIGNPMRAFILTSVYLVLLVLSWIIILPLAILALIDLLFNLRQRRAAAATGNDE